MMVLTGGLFVRTLQGLGKGRDGAQNAFAITERHFELLEIILRQLRKQVGADPGFGKPLRILFEPNRTKPFLD